MDAGYHSQTTSARRVRESGAKGSWRDASSHSYCTRPTAQRPVGAGSVTLVRCWIESRRSAMASVAPPSAASAATPFSARLPIARDRPALGYSRPVLARWPPFLNGEVSTRPGQLQATSSSCRPARRVDHGRQPEGLQLAEQATETYSGAGLETLARLLERMGRFAEAEAWLKKEADRYDDTRGLEQFQMRRERRNPGAGDVEPAHAALRKRFPLGLERVHHLDFLAPPRQGVEIVQWSSKLEALGLDKGDVIVALDGYRVTSYEQYHCIRDLTDDPTHPLVWIEAPAAAS